MSFEGRIIKNLTGVKTIITIHGLDITYNNFIYQKIIPNSVNKLDKIICISNSTREECLKRGIDKEKIAIIPNGVNFEEFCLFNTL
jgi:glycosyltransferase involved in cell wall biosynthesis